MSYFVVRPGILAVALIALSGCDDQGFDLDLRGELGGFDTTEAARMAIADRPRPDDRGLISYPNYQVAVARRNDTIEDVAARVGLPAAELAEYNGLPLNYVMRKGEIVVLPRPRGRTLAGDRSLTTGPIVAPEDAPEALAEAQAAVDAANAVITPAPSSSVDVTALAEESLARAEQVEPVPAPRIATGEEPVRHKVAKGETAYSIARKYNVPVSALAEWNGLDREYTVRLGQYLLIPVVEPGAVVQAEPEKPGEGSVTPVPPSAAEPLPDPEDATPAPPEATPASPELAQEVTAAATTGARMIYPASGKVVRAYAKGRNDGIDISTDEGSAVRAAEGGSVAAITYDTDNVPILILRHADNVLTIYSGVKDIAVNKGDQVKQGQEIARVSNLGLLHFEVREGFDAVDPALYLE